MTRENAKKLLPIIAAYAEGKVIQMKFARADKWKDINEPTFDFAPGHYRIKPEPRIFNAVIDPDSSVMVVRESATDKELRDWTPIKLLEILD